MNPLVSVITPTRRDFVGLKKMVDSLLESAADPSRIQFVLKVDQDDTDRQERIKQWNPPQTLVVLSERGAGYLDMPRFVSEAAMAAIAPWSFLIDDDAWIEGHGWDERLASLPLSKQRVAQCEFYHLGGSHYGSGSCAQNGLFVPTEIARGLPHIGGAADVMLAGLTVDAGWPISLLSGIAYCHDGRAR